MRSIPGNSNPQRAFIRRSVFCDHGGVSIFVAFTIAILIVMSGIGIDVMRGQMVRTKMQAAMDAASLAGASLPLGATPADREQIARRYYAANYPDDYMGGDLGAGGVTITVDNRSVRVSGGTLVSTNYMPVNGGANNAPINTASVAVFEQEVPAAVDLVIGLDGGCGNENHKFGSMNEGVRGLINGILQVDQSGTKYAAGIWSGVNVGFSQNTQNDVNYVSGNLQNVANRVGNHRSSGSGQADNGTYMIEVMNEALSASFNVQGETRDPLILPAKKRIAVLFQGAHHHEENGGSCKANPESCMVNACNNFKGSFDAVYAVSVRGSQNDNGDCSRGRGGQRGFYPTSALAYNIQTCNKQLPGININQDIDQYSLGNEMNQLGQAIGRLTTIIPGNPRIER